MKIIYYKIIFKKLRIDLRITIPRVESRGKYDVIGNVLVLPVRSNGEFWAEFSTLLLVVLFVY